MAAPTSPIVNNDMPAEWASAVTPSDSTQFTVTPRGLFIGGDGNVSALMADGSTVLFKGLTAGYILPVRVIRVNATGTTATDIVGLY